MADVRATKNGNWSDITVWNTGALPTAADDVYSNTFTVNVDVNFTVLTLRSTSGTGITAGGSFAFNTAGVTGNVTNTNPLRVGAANLITVTATTGNIGLTLGGNVNVSAFGTFSHTGNCNFTITGFDFFGSNSTITNIISKTSSGTITINGNIYSGTNNTAIGLSSTNGNTIINGNVFGGSGAATEGVRQTAGNLTINGNVNGGASGTSGVGVNFSGVVLTINGIVTAGGGPVAVSSITANQITINGTATASATANAVSMTNANGQVFLNGNMVNNNGKMAIYAPIVWLGATTTTSAQFFTSGGADRTLYSADTVPNAPAANNVRKGTIYGAGNSLTGTLSMPTIADVRSGVTYDNGSVGTALFTTATLLTEIGSSSDPVAVRLRNLATPDILGELMEAYKK